MKVEIEIVAPPYEVGPVLKAMFEPIKALEDADWTPRKIWSDFQNTEHAAPYKLKKWACRVAQALTRGDRKTDGPLLRDGDSVTFYVVPRRGKHRGNGGRR